MTSKHVVTRLTDKQRELLHRAAASASLSASAGVGQGGRTVDALVEKGLGSRGFCGAPIFFINQDGLREAGFEIREIQP